MQSESRWIVQGSRAGGCIGPLLAFLSLNECPDRVRKRTGILYGCGYNQSQDPELVNFLMFFLLTMC